MITVLIKSFNRAFYLERCLQSIFKFVDNNLKIKVLDDGTPEKYLNKIQTKYPEVEILKSKNYNQKSELITEKKEINGFEIPTDLWKSAVKNSSEFVLVIEDDVWFTEKTDLNQIISGMKSHNIDLVKLGWLGNYKDRKSTRLNSSHVKISYAV